MGREVRQVAKDWQHPKNEKGNYRPLHEGWLYTERIAEWREKVAEGGEQAAIDWMGRCPDRNDYMPDWPEAEATHLMMYEDTSEGTPISPAFETPEELARWLADNKASAFGDMTATYEQWLAMVKDGWAPSAVITVGPSGGVMTSGVAIATGLKP